MENASKALIMAGGILIGMLLLTFLVVMFTSAGNVSQSYDDTKREEAIQQFNSNFTKYLGKELTIHQVVTICNFAEKNGVSVINAKYENSIQTDVKNYIVSSNTLAGVSYYELEISSYSDEGYINGIMISQLM